MKADSWIDDTIEETEETEDVLDGGWGRSRPSGAVDGPAPEVSALRGADLGTEGPETAEGPSTAEGPATARG